RRCRRRARSTSRRSPSATRCASSSPRRWRSSAPLARGSCASTANPRTRIARPVLLDRAIVRLLPAVPRPVVQRLSSRYIAGPDLEDAVRAVRGLNAQGKMATVDVLGEDVTNPRDARAIAQEYLDVFEEIERDALD